MYRLPRNSYEFNTDPNKGIDYILSAIRGLQSGGVSQIIAGTNVTISPVSGTGAVTINASGGGSIPTLDQVTTAGNTTTNNITAAEIVATSHFKLQNGGKLYSNASSVTLQSAASNPILFNVSTTEVARIASTGNLLLGTTTDAGYKLDVNGTGRFATSLEITSTGGLSFGGGATALSWTGSSLHIGNSATWADVRIFTLGVQKFSQTSSLTTINNTIINLATNTVQLAGVNALTWSGTDIRIGSVSAGFNSLSMYVAGSEKVRIDSTGNVGIGTTTPESSLHVKYSSSTLPGITIENDGIGYNAGSITLRSGTTGGTNMSVTVGGGMYWYNLDSFSNTLSLPATGNLIVGGAVDAGYRLDVQGGDARFAQNVEAASYSVAGNAGYSGIINFPGNPPGQQNLEYLHGILINVF